MLNAVEGFPVRKIEDYDLTPCDVIFKHVDKPKDFLYCRSINVFENRWRVNIYSKRFIYDIEGQYISASYFIHFDKATGSVKIVSPNN